MAYEHADAINLWHHKKKKKNQALMTKKSKIFRYKKTEQWRWFAGFFASRVMQSARRVMANSPHHKIFSRFAPWQAMMLNVRNAPLK